MSEGHQTITDESRPSEDSSLWGPWGYVETKEISGGSFFVTPIVVPYDSLI